MSVQAMYDRIITHGPDFGLNTVTGVTAGIEAVIGSGKLHGR